jgi:hypothetical protein
MESLRGAADTYRLIVTRRSASEILLFPNGSAWTLPRIEVNSQQRLAEQLTAEVARAWGLEAYCLFVPSAGASDANREARYALMESVRNNDKQQAGTYWVPLSVAISSCHPEEASAIRDALAKLNSHAKGERPGEFARPGWLSELFRWAQDQIAPLGLRLTGAFRQLNASPTFSLIRLETNAGALWFKATGEPNSHELPVTVALGRLFPPYVPEILGVHHAWNGWLSEEVAGVSLDQLTEFSAWERVAEELANLQIASVGRSVELFEAQTKDLRLPILVERIDPFVARMDELMSAQEKPTPAPLVRSELATLAQGLRDCCALLASCDLPNTIGHIDFSPGNILVAADRCVFLDWAEGCITNPLLTLEYLREHMARSRIEKPSGGERLVAAYLRPWSASYSPDDLRRALAVSPLIAVFAYSVANDSWRAADVIHKPKLAGYFRSLTRRMYREAIQAAERSELCLS